MKKIIVVAVIMLFAGCASPSVVNAPVLYKLYAPQKIETVSSKWTNEKNAFILIVDEGGKAQRIYVDFKTFMDVSEGDTVKYLKTFYSRKYVSEIYY